jgi:ribosome-associated protein
VQKQNFPLTSEYIELIALLKFLGIAQTGGHAKMIVEEGLVYVNGNPEDRKRYKVRKGDIVVVNNEIEITAC